METDLIYDVGMNNGDDTAYYLFRGYRVVAIDADPQLVEQAQHRFAEQINAGRLTLLDVAIGPEEGIAKFWISEKSREWNSFDMSVASRLGMPCHTIDVHCRRFHDILKEYGVPYYLKVDIEGHDHYCLLDLDPNDLPRYVSVEMAGLDYLGMLRGLGYNAFKCIIQNDFTQLAYAPPGLCSPHGAAPERSVLPVGPDIKNQWEFRFGSSGPFGEDTDGEWQTFEQCAFSWLAFRLGYIGDQKSGVWRWHDIHCCRIPAFHLPADELMTGVSGSTWRHQSDLAAEEIAAVVPPGQPLILVDEGKLGDEFLSDGRIIPFLERNGQYWGKPRDDEMAIREFDRLQRSGASFMAFVWPAFWWLDHYQGFHHFLRSKYRRVLHNDRLIIFDLRS